MKNKKKWGCRKTFRFATAPFLFDKNQGKQPTKSIKKVLNYSSYDTEKSGQPVAILLT